MRYSRKFRLQAVLCSLAVFVCVLISLPFTTMSVLDDGPFIRVAQTLANTGHIVYNGWEAMMLVAQIYIAQPFIKLFGYSFTTVRMSTLLIAVVAAFVFHRALVRTGSSERNATLGTLAVVISPMYLVLSATFMSDIIGLFAIMLCLYGCVRAIQASADPSAIGWICFGAFTCAVLGTSRQIAWLGDLVMVPSTLLLLRRRKRVILGGGVVTAFALLFILGCVHWLSRQPYVISVPLIATSTFSFRQLGYIVLEIPFLVLPLIAVFTPRIFTSRPRIRFVLLALLVTYVVIALPSRNDYTDRLYLEPTAGYIGAIVNFYGVAATVPGTPVVVHTATSVVLTIICLGGLLGVVTVAIQAFGARSSPRTAPHDLSWKQLAILLLPFSVAYLMFLAAAAGTTAVIFDRYAIGLLGPTVIVLVRLWQQQVQPNLPPATILLIIIMGAYGVIVTHNTFALDRARVDLADELHAHGVSFTAIDGGWDYNFDTELDNSNHINDPRIKFPAPVIPPPAPPGICPVFFGERTPHVQGLYRISFLSDSCYGRAPFAPVQYRPWPFRTPLNLYAVRSASPDESLVHAPALRPASKTSPPVPAPQFPRPGAQP